MGAFRLDRYTANNDPEFETKAADIIGRYKNCADIFTDVTKFGHATARGRSPIRMIITPLGRTMLGRMNLATIRAVGLKNADLRTSGNL
jgi:hypothetical protein